MSIFVSSNNITRVKRIVVTILRAYKEKLLQYYARKKIITLVVVTTRKWACRFQWNSGAGDIMNCGLLLGEAGKGLDDFVV